MSILPNSRFTLYITRKKITFFQKFAENPISSIDLVNITRAQLAELLKKNIPVNSKSKSPLDIDLIFGLDMAFINSTKKLPRDLYVLADQYLPYTTDDADFFIAEGEKYPINTVFASPNPVKKLLTETFGDKINIGKSFPQVIMFSPKILTKLSPKSHCQLTVIENDTKILTLLSLDEFTIDFQRYEPPIKKDFLANLLKVYSADPDFNVNIDTVVTDQDFEPISGSTVQIIKINPLKSELDDLLISNFSKLKNPKILTNIDLKKLDNADNSSLSTSSGSAAGGETEHRKISPKSPAVIITAAVLLVIAGIIIFIQFQSLSPKSKRQNGTVAPAANSQTTIVPSKKFSQPKNNSPIQVVPATESSVLP